MKRSLRKYTLLVTLAFSWVFIGALVNFHQVHVLGKNLPQASWTFVKPKTADNQLNVDIDKSAKKIADHPLFSATILESNTGFFACLPFVIIQNMDRNNTWSTDLCRGPGLRAPPAA